MREPKFKVGDRVLRRNGERGIVRDYDENVSTEMPYLVQFEDQALWQCECSLTLSDGASKAEVRAAEARSACARGFRRADGSRVAFDRILFTLPSGNGVEAHFSATPDLQNFLHIRREEATAFLAAYDRWLGLEPLPEGDSV